MLGRESCRSAISGSVCRRGVQADCAKGMLARSSRGFSARNVGFAKNCPLSHTDYIETASETCPDREHLGNPLRRGAGLRRGLPHVGRCGHFSTLSILYYKEPFSVFRSFELQRCFFSILFACFAPELLSEIKTCQVVFV